MKSDIDAIPVFAEAIREKKLAFVFGAGSSIALCPNAKTWYSWLQDGIALLHDESLTVTMREELENCANAESVIETASKIIEQSKQEQSYHTWMNTTIASLKAEDNLFAEAIRLLSLSQDPLVTTNYDSLIEQATGLRTLTQQDRAFTYSMLDDHRSTGVIHIHGAYEPSSNLDNIVASASQYQEILQDDGAQFVQNVISAKSMVFVGCGKTTEDPNIAKLIEFATAKLGSNVRHFYLHRTGEDIGELPACLIPVPYGSEYDDLAGFVRDVAIERLRAKSQSSPLIAYSPDKPYPKGVSGLGDLHYASQTVGFHGRSMELSRLKAFLESDSHISWWAIVGQAGSGKSRIAFELMQRAAPSYYAFFLNPHVYERYAADFVPFNDTLVIIDYVKGQERSIAPIISRLFETFEPSRCRLRVLFVERSSSTFAGSWYSSLLESMDPLSRQVFSQAEFSPDSATRGHLFLDLGDLDETAVLKLIADVFDQHHLPPDEHRDAKLMAEYANRKEHLRFRPLYVRLFVEAFIESGCVQPQHDRKASLIDAALDREQARWLDNLGNDRPTCSALIRVLVYAIMVDGVETTELPPARLADWNAVTRRVGELSLPGTERYERLGTVIEEASHSISEGKSDSADGNSSKPSSIAAGPANSRLIRPAYPDALKEAMFIRYSDETNMDEFCNDAWLASPAEFSEFLYRASTDFQSSPVLHAYVNRATSDYSNHYAMSARLARVQSGASLLEFDDDEDERTVIEESRYWQGMPCDEEGSRTEVRLKTEGLVLSGMRLLGNGLIEEAMRCFVALSQLNVNDEHLLAKVTCLVDAVKACTRLELWGNAERLIEKTLPLIESLEDHSGKRIAKLEIAREHAASLMGQGEWDEADRLYEPVKCFIDWTNAQEVELFAYFSLTYVQFNCNLIQPRGNELLSYADELQSMAEDYGSGARPIAFDDKTHYYYLHSKLLKCEHHIAATTLAGEEAAGFKRYFLQNVMVLIDEIKHNEMINDFSGLLIGAYALRTGYDESVSDNEASAYIEEAFDLMRRYPDNRLLAKQFIDLIHAAYGEQFKEPLPDDMRSTVFGLALRFIDDRDVSESLFFLIETMDDSVLRAKCADNQILATRLAAYDEQRQFSERLHAKIAAFNEAGRPKVGRNEPCPCGSGKKFKKCCLENGLFD